MTPPKSVASSTFLLPATSLLLLLLLRIVQLGSAKQILSVSGPCQDRCEKERPPGIADSYLFECQEKSCRADCEQCPKEVCDETNSSHSWHDWHCPPSPVQLGPECIQLCNDKRPKGNPAAYKLNCQTDYSTEEDREKCRDQCDKCPGYVCNLDSDLNIFNCPRDSSLQSSCNSECDKARVKQLDNKAVSSVQPFSFKCSDVHSSSIPDTEDCQKTCKQYCPAYVCDGSQDPDTYHCPSATLENMVVGECFNFCDKHVSEISSDKTVECTKELSKTKCEAICRTCHSLQGINFVCKQNSPDLFYCPMRAPKRTPPPSFRRSYKGPCKLRCEASRAGGPHPFNLTCENSSLYSTPQERLSCHRICTQDCSEKICHLIPPHNHSIIQCPGDTAKLQKLEAEAKKIETEKQTKIDILKNDQFQLILFLGLIAFALFFLLLALCWYCGKMRRKLKRVQHGHPPAAQPPEPTGSNVNLFAPDEHHQPPHSAAEHPQHPVNPARKSERFPGASTHV